MKKLISALAVVFALVASYSCQREADYITDPTQAVTVTYNVSLDQIQKTKTTLAELDGLAVNKLFYSVYQVVNNELKIIDYSGYHQVVALDDQGTASVTLKVIQGETYKVVFWAQKDGKYVALPASGSDLTLTTDNSVKHSPLESISIDYDNAASYAGDADAFTAVDEFSIAVGGESISKSVHLKRPFAQINFGTNDAADAAALGYTAYSAAVTVKQAATSFNALTGVAGGAADATLLVSVLPTTPVDFDINQVTYRRVAKAYVLPAGTFTVSQNDNSAGISSPLSGTAEVSLSLVIKKGENSFQIGPRVNANTPIRSNYRTNLLGSLITADATFSVVVDNDFEGSTDHISIVSLGNAAGSGAITMEDPETINTDINFGDHPVTLDAPLTINGNVTISSNDGAITITHDDVSGEDNSIVVAAGATLTLSGVDLQGATGVTTLVKVEQGGHLIITSGTYAGEYFVNLVSGSSNPAPVAPGVQHRAKGADGDQLIIRGGTFVGFNPTPYVDDVHYTITEDPTGTWTVTAKQVTLTVDPDNILDPLFVGSSVNVALTVSPADTDLSALAFEYSADGIVTAEYDADNKNVVITGVAPGNVVITVKLGAATATIGVGVMAVNAVSVSPTSVTVYPGNDSDDITISANNGQTISSVVSSNTDVATVVWTNGATTFKVHGVAVSDSPVTVTVTTNQNVSATLSVTVSTAPALGNPSPSAANSDIDDDSILVKWAPVANATSYEVKYKLSTASEYTILDNGLIDLTKNPIEALIGDLAPAKSYDITVQAKDGVSYSPSAAVAISATTKKGDVTIEVAQANESYSIAKGLTATIAGVTVKYKGSAIDVPVTYALGTDASGKITLSGTTITAVDLVDLAGINVVFAGNDTYNAKTEEDAITVTVTPATLTGITLNADDLSANVKKTFTVGDPFSHDNLVVTAHYTDNSTAIVTDQAEFSGYDMSTAGQQTVTVTYEGQTATYTITVNEPAQKTAQAITLTYNNAAIGEYLNKTYGDAAFTISATAPSDNVVLASQNTQVATVSGTTITILKAGSAVITANAAETETFQAAPEVSFTLNVAKATGAITIADNASVGVGADVDVTYTGATGAVTASSSATGVATVDYATAGKLVIHGVAAGNATVTVNVAASDNYDATSATIAVVVSASVPGSGEGTQASPYDVTRALYLTQQLADNGKSGEVYVQGTVKEVTEIATGYHNATYTIAVNSTSTDVLTVFRGKGINGENIDDANYIMAGDVLVVNGTLENYFKNDVRTYEISSGNQVVSFVSQVARPLAAPANLVVGKTNDKKITATWNAVDGAASYTVKIDDEEFANATTSFTSASAYADGTYSVSVKAVGTTAPDSPYCTALSVTIGDVQSGLSLPFNETFTGSNGSAGFSGNSGNGNSPQYDNENWDVTNAYGASDAIKLGKSGEGGKAITPAINYSGNATLTFKAGSWSGDQTTLKVSVSSGHIENTSGETITSVTMNDAAWSVHHLYLKGVSAGFTVTFESNQASKARFFLDDVTIVEGLVAPAAKALESISVSGQTTSFKQGDTFAFGGTVTATYTDATTADVTDKATFTGYDMSTISESQTVTVTYTENNVTKTTTYTIAVTDPNAGTNYSTLYTTDSGVTLSGGSSAQVVIGGTSYSAVKLEGRNGKTIQSLSLTIPTGTTKVHLFIGAWNNGNASVTVSDGSIDNASLTADSGISSNSPFTLSSTSTDSFYKVITVTNNATSITITPSGERILIWGVNPE